MANAFGVKLSIDNKVIAKARATSKKKLRKASQRAYFASFQKNG
jgi:ribonuclease-3